MRSSDPTFIQQIVLQLIGPVTAAVLGTLIIGGSAQYVAFQVQRRQADRKFRESLIARVSATAYSMHYRLESYERWVRHSKPRDQDREKAKEALVVRFTEDRVDLGALQNEIDTYFQDEGPGPSLHRLTDLAMIKFYEVSAVPERQLIELREAVAGPRHTELTVPQMEDARLVQRRFAEAMKEAMNSILISPLRNKGGFVSSKILTGPDGRYEAAPEAPSAKKGRTRRPSTTP